MGLDEALERVKAYVDAAGRRVYQRLTIEEVTLL